MKHIPDKTVAEQAPQSSSALVVDLGRVQDLTGGNGSGQFEDGSKTSSHRKDEYGGAGER